jgi:hypothetical protein
MAGLNAEAANTDEPATAGVVVFHLLQVKAAVPLTALPLAQLKIFPV